MNNTCFKDYKNTTTTLKQMNNNFIASSQQLHYMSQTPNQPAEHQLVELRIGLIFFSNMTT